MEESFLHFIWKFQHFDYSFLKTDSGKIISIFDPGHKNTDAGPDFKNAKIKIGEIVWNGSVEIHINSLDWNRHNHQHNPAYDNVILHVVWKNDASVKRNDGTIIPTLELKNLVNENIFLKYQQLLLPKEDILCKNYLSEVKSLSILSMLDNALARRMEMKAGKIFRDIALTGHDWEEIAWRSLSGNFGFKTNAEPFRELAKSVPVKVLKKEAYNQQTIEALLFGQAGFLEGEPIDEYHQTLIKEYHFKSRKYGLERRLDRHQWKFLRLRPANFPTIRIAQLANLISKKPNLFSFFVEYTSVKSFISEMETDLSHYWKIHYDFGKVAKSTIGNLGRSSKENILINTAAPLLFSYGIHKDQESLKEKAVELLENLKPEANHIITSWKEAGIEVKTAFDSQALIEQYNSFCLKKQCLSCAVGVEIIRAGG